MIPFFSIVTVTRNDVWALTKTARSVFRQGFKNFEYIILDGASNDGTDSLAKFWKSAGLVGKFVSEPDSGVYNAMNKGVRLANGHFVCLLNAGDIFASDDVLEKAFNALNGFKLDGILGWGELNGQIWASWAGHEAFKLASLGFCHQSLFVKRDLIIERPFDERSFKTDSDTRQLGSFYEHGADIKIIPEVLAIRGGEPGISANLERTKISIINTLVEEYAPLTTNDAEKVLLFRRTCEEPEYIMSLLASAPPKLRLHIAYMVLDTLFLRQSAKMSQKQVNDLYIRASQALCDTADKNLKKEVIQKLLTAQSARLALMDRHKESSKKLKNDLRIFQEEEDKRISKLSSERTVKPYIGDFVVSLTSFPARIPSLHHVIRSLFEQTVRPREVHLWLGQDEIPNKNWLPKALLNFEALGLKINFARRTFHQYDKFLHNSQVNGNVPFVIVDDDVIYPPNSMEELVLTHNRFPNAVIANRAHMIGISEAGEIKDYSHWRREIEVVEPSLLAFPTGAGGVLYPVGFLTDTDVTNIPNILSHAPYADDVWLKVCALARGIPTMTTRLSKGSTWYLRYTPTMREGALHATNVDLGLNDMQLSRSFEWLSKIKPMWRDDLLNELQGHINAN